MLVTTLAISLLLNARKHLHRSLSFNKATAIIKKEIPVRVFSYEFYKVFKSSFFYTAPLGHCFCNLNWFRKTQ